MRTNYVLIDFENVHVKSLALLKEDHFRIKVFLGPKNNNLPRDLVLAMQAHGDRAEYIVLETAGKNALDFHLAYYLGSLAANDPTGYFHIISKDTGFDPLIKHLKIKKVFVARSSSVDEMPCFKPVAPSADALPVTESSPLPSEQQVNGKSEAIVEDLVKSALDDLVKRKASKPRTTKTLRSTIHAKCGKDLPTAIIDNVYSTLINRGYVKVNGTKVTYSLSSA